MPKPPRTTLAAIAAASIDDLRQHNCLRYLTSGRPLDWTFLKNGIAKTVSVAGNFDTDDGGALIAAARAGTGIAYVFRFQAQGYFSTGELVPILTQYATPSQDAYAVHAYSRHVSPRVRAWVDFLRDSIGDPRLVSDMQRRESLFTPRNV